MHRKRCIITSRFVFETVFAVIRQGWMYLLYPMALVHINLDFSAGKSHDLHVPQSELQLELCHHLYMMLEFCFTFFHSKVLHDKLSGMDKVLWVEMVLWETNQTLVCIK